MSGHSKWANIRRTKEKVDAARGKIFTKIGKELQVAVKSGGADPDTNPRLRDMIAKAKANNMPNDNISRVIKKASGEGNSANYDSITYEGYGVGGSAVIVNVLTDNKNRTAGDVRHIFEKHGGNLGSNGSVSYLFKRQGNIVIEKSTSISEDQMLEWALDAGAEDMIVDEDVYEIITDPSQINAVGEFLNSKGLTFVSSEVEMCPDMYVELDEKNYERFENMIERLEENDDVQEVFHNVSEKDYE